MDLPVLDIPHAWNHTLCRLWGQLLSLSIVFDIHLCGSICQCSVLSMTEYCLTVWIYYVLKNPFIW